MATNIKVYGKGSYGNGQPRKADFIAIGQSVTSWMPYINRDANFGERNWIYDPVAKEFIPDPDLNRQELQAMGGSSSAPTVSVGTTTTLPAGSQATVTDADPSGNVTLNFGIPKGDKGDAGTGGGSVSGASIVVVPNGTNDTAQLQSAIAQQKTTGRPIELYGNYITTSDLILDKDHHRLVIIGNRAIIQGFGIKRVKPSDNNDALNNMVTAQYLVSDLTFKGGNFEPGPSYGSVYSNLKFEGGTMRLQFSLGTKVYNPYFINSTKGLIIDYGDWSGATNYNSQSNQTQVFGGRFYGHATSEVAIGIYGASGCSVADFIIEGEYVKTGIDFDSKASPVVKDFNVSNVHYECPRGGDQFIKLRLNGNDIVKIDKCYGQYPVKFMDASSISGLSYIEIAHIPWWRGKGEAEGANGKGKMFTTSNVTLHFEKSYAFNNVNSTMWEGAAATPAGDAKEGNTIAAYHTYTINRINPYA